MKEEDIKKMENTPEDYESFLSGIVNVKQETDEGILEVAEQNDAALIAFIAPYRGVRISPTEEARAFISIADEFGVEALVRKISNTHFKNAYLLVNSPGGAMSSSYKIARAIRITFDNIITFVPHIAASGGTLLALAGNEIVMGPMSHLTPLDVQINYKETSVSAATFMKFFTRATKWFETTKPEEAPYPRKALADKLDPFIMEEWSGSMDTAIDYVSDILNLAGYEDSSQIANRLVLAYPSHSYVITQEKANEIGLSTRDSTEVEDIWDMMRYWLSKYMFEEEMTHCIRYVLPSIEKDITKKEENNDSKK